MVEPAFSPFPANAVYEPVVEVAEETPVVVNTEVETPVVETPTPEVVIETPIADPVIVETPTTVEVIKEVEKIVEKYPEMDEYTGQIFKALMDGKEEELLNYLSTKHRNYQTMSDYDAVKESLRLKNPNWSDDDLDLKIEVQYGDIAKIDLTKISEADSPVEYAEAVEYNKSVDRNLKLLRLDAVEGRQALEANKKNITLPKIETPVVEAQKQPTAEEIAQGRAAWESLVTTEVPKVKEFSWKVGDDENVTFKIDDKELAENVELMKNLNSNSLALDLGWMDKDGKQDIGKIAGDVRLIKSIKQIVASAYTQGKTAGAKGTAAEIKNIDLSNKSQSTVAATPTDIGVLGFSHLNPK